MYMIIMFSWKVSPIEHVNRDLNYLSNRKTIFKFSWAPDFTQIFHIAGVFALGIVPSVKTIINGQSWRNTNSLHGFLQQAIQICRMCCLSRQSKRVGGGARTQNPKILMHVGHAEFFIYLLQVWGGFFESLFTRVNSVPENSVAGTLFTQWVYICKFQHDQWLPVGWQSNFSVWHHMHCKCSFTCCKLTASTNEHEESVSRSCSDMKHVSPIWNNRVSWFASVISQPFFVRHERTYK